MLDNYAQLQQTAFTMQLILVKKKLEKPHFSIMTVHAEERMHLVYWKQKL